MYKFSNFHNTRQLRAVFRTGKLKCCPCVFLHTKLGSEGEK